MFSTVRRRALTFTVREKCVGSVFVQRCPHENVGVGSIAMYGTYREPSFRERAPFRREPFRREREPFRDWRESFHRERQSYPREIDRREPYRGEPSRREPYGRGRESYGRGPGERESYGRRREFYGRQRESYGRQRDSYSRQRDSYQGRESYGRVPEPYSRGERVPYRDTRESIALDVVRLIQVPDAALDAANRFIARPGHKVTGFAILKALRVSPFVDGRLEVMRRLIDVLAAMKFGPFTDSAWNSHTAAISQLADLPDDKARKGVFGLILESRFADAPFMSLDDFTTALPTFENPLKPILMYLYAFPYNVVRMQASWECDAFAKRESSYEKKLAEAMETLKAVEAFIAENHPEVMETDVVHTYLQDAFAAIGMRTEPRKHWEWLLEHRSVNRVAADCAMRMATDLPALQTVRSEVSDIWTRDSPQHLICLDSLYAQHLFRLGHRDQAERVLGKSARFTWYLTTMNDIRRIRSPRTRSLMERSARMTENGFDFAAIEWFLRSFF